VRRCRPSTSRKISYRNHGTKKLRGSKDLFREELRVGGNKGYEKKIPREEVEEKYSMWNRGGI